MREREIIARIRELFPGGDDLLDDCGALPAVPEGQRMLVTTDLLESGCHFRLEWHPPEMLGRKLLLANLSDLDASGARPLGFTLTLAIGPEVEEVWLDALLKGLADEAAARDVPLLGGDTVGRPSGMGLGITAFGAAERWLRRDGMLAGDRIYVDRMPGASLQGLRKLEAGQRWDPAHPDADLAAHLDPRPNLGLGVRLAAMPEVHACIDLSDGISRDLAMLAEASGLSVIVSEALDHDALTGGEDYARCFASPLGKDELERRLGLPLVAVGEALPRQDALLLLYDGGVLRPFPDLSHDHFAPRT